MFAAAEAVESRIAAPIRVDHEHGTQVIIAAFGGRTVELIADQKKRPVGLFAIVTSRPETVKQAVCLWVGREFEDHSVIRRSAIGCHPVKGVTRLNNVTVVGGGAVGRTTHEVMKDLVVVTANIDAEHDTVTGATTFARHSVKGGAVRIKCKPPVRLMTRWLIERINWLIIQRAGIKRKDDATVVIASGFSHAVEKVVTRIVNHHETAVRLVAG